jgi:hypothetical protein
MGPELRKYLEGDGVDVSHNEKFSEPNNLYSLRDSFDYESLDFIYSKNLINATKFYNILIKEWMNFCKVEGYIIIEMRSNEILSFEALLRECKLLMLDKGEIVDKGKTGEGSRFVVLKKTKPILRSGDTLDKWTFGIITDGSNNERVDRIIESIVRQGIPKFEIIICGDYDIKSRDRKYVSHIPFAPKIAWITKKKNLICEKARYENLVIIHDRYIFDENWYEGMKKYGNYFEVLSCITFNTRGERTDDWITFGMNKDPLLIGNLGYLDYRDWDRNGYLQGGLYVMKKWVWENFHWDESLIWGQAEDIKLSRQWYKSGIVARFNQFSKCTTLTDRGNWISFGFNKDRNVILGDAPLRKRIVNGIRRFAKGKILRQTEKDVF